MLLPLPVLQAAREPHDREFSLLQIFDLSWIFFAATTLWISQKTCTQAILSSGILVIQKLIKIQGTIVDEWVCHEKILFKEITVHVHISLILHPREPGRNQQIRNSRAHGFRRTCLSRKTHSGSDILTWLLRSLFSEIRNLYCSCPRP
jgi:hypothetical protein